MRDGCARARQEVAKPTVGAESSRQLAVDVTRPGGGRIGARGNTPNHAAPSDRREDPTQPARREPRLLDRLGITTP